MTWQTDTDSSEQTEQLGERLAAHLKPPAVIELVADLGGGKTTLVKGLARGLGCTDTVTSPTFTISREYPCLDSLYMHHFDFYRLSEAGVVAEALRESVQNPNVITVIEWGEIVHSVLPDNKLTITLVARSDNPSARTITFSYNAPMQPAIQALEDEWVRQ